MRTANDFNREYMYHAWHVETESAQKPSPKQAVRNFIFYGILIIMVAVSFFYSSNRDAGKQFGPFAYNTVLTSSMQSVYPQGSLITSWAVKPTDVLRAGLEDGTDIVFVRENGDVVVHRIIEIINNYDESGLRAFRTQGVDNSAPDTWITYEGNVVGRVTWHVPYLGNILSIIGENILLVIGGVVLLVALLSLWRVVFKKEEPKSLKTADSEKPA